MNVRETTLMLCAAGTLAAASIAVSAQDRGTPTSPYEQQQRPGSDRLQPQERPASSFDANTSIRAFPSETFFQSETFNERTIQGLERAGIRTVGELIKADPLQVGKRLKMDPRAVRDAQRRIHESLR